MCCGNDMKTFWNKPKPSHELADLKTGAEVNAKRVSLLGVRVDGTTDNPVSVGVNVLADELSDKFSSDESLRIAFALDAADGFADGYVRVGVIDDTVVEDALQMSVSPLLLLDVAEAMSKVLKSSKPADVVEKKTKEKRVRTMPIRQIGKSNWCDSACKVTGMSTGMGGRDFSYIIQAGCRCR